MDKTAKQDAGAPLPWRVVGTWVEDANGIGLLTTGVEPDEDALAALSTAVRAVNGEAAARERERALRDALKGVLEKATCGCRAIEHVIQCPMRAVRAALAVSGEE